MTQLTPRRVLRGADITRAIRAAQKAGLVVDRVEVDADGRIIVTSARVAKAAVGGVPDAPPEKTELEKWRERKRAREAQGH
jgi:hypothetical protein